MKLFKFTPLLLAFMLAACAITPSSSQTPSSLEPSSSEVPSSSEPTPSSEEPSSEVPSSEEPSSEVPSSSEEPEPSSEEPSSDEPSSEEPEPSSEEPEPSSEQPIAGWNEDELALIDTYAYGAEIPYLLLEGNEELYYDDYYGCLSMTGASVEKTDLDAYAQLFIDAEWDVISTLEDGYIYEFSKTINTAGGERIIVADIYAIEEDYYADQGIFWLDIYDPYLYEWDAELVNEIVYYLTGQEISVPAFEAKYYAFTTSFISYGMAWVECYTDDADASSVYEEDLIAAGYSINKDEIDVDFLAYDPSGYLMISVTYYAEYGYLDITFYALEVPPEEDPDGGYSALSVMKEICYNLFEDETAYGDDGEGGYYTVVSFGEAEETDEYLTYAVETVIEYLPSYLVVYEEPVMDIWSDDTAGCFATYLSDDGSIVVQLGSFYDYSYNELCCQINVYAI